MRRCCSWLRHRCCCRRRTSVGDGELAVSLHSLPVVATPSKEEALDKILHGCQMMKSLNISPEVAQVVIDLELNAERLRSLTLASPCSDDSTVSFWPRPPLQEQSEWAQVCPGGGRLLHTQVCIVAHGVSSEEWFMGRLFVSELGIAVQGVSGIFTGQDEAALFTGVLHWEHVEDMGIDKTEAQIHLRTSALATRVYRLQLGVGAECDRLREAWGKLKDSNLPFHSFCDEHDQRCIPPIATFQQAADAPITQSFLAESDALPAQVNFKEAKPLCSSLISGVTLSDIRRLAEKNDDWFLCRFQREALKAWDMAATPWTEGKLLRDTLVRRLSFKIPAPDDVPKAIARAIGFPQVIETSLVARLHCTDSQIALVMQSCSPNVPYGDCQRLEDVVIFTPDGDDGVTVSKWMKIVWVKSLPWTVNIAKGWLEKKVQDEAKSTFGQYVALVLKLCTRS